MNKEIFTYYKTGTKYYITTIENYHNYITDLNKCVKCDCDNLDDVIIIFKRYFNNCVFVDHENNVIIDN